MRPDDRRAQLLRQINKVLDRKKLVEPKPKKEKEQKEWVLPAAKIAYKVGKAAAPKVGQAITKINPAAAGMASAVANNAKNWAQSRFSTRVPPASLHLLPTYPPHFHMNSSWYKGQLPSFAPCPPSVTCKETKSSKRARSARVGKGSQKQVESKEHKTNSDS